MKKYGIIEYLEHFYKLTISTIITFFTINKYI